MVNTAAVAAAKGSRGSGLPLASLNHISIVCRSLQESLTFYTDVLGFFPVRRPGSFDFDGAWLFNYGIGIHLLQAEDPDSLPGKTEINPKDNHISFQCESMVAVERRLKELGIPYIQRCVEEGGIYVDQIFFHDPDGFMIEICNCDNLPVVPLGADQPLVMAACKRAAVIKQQQQASSSPATAAAAAQCAVPSSTKAIHVGEEAHISCA
ncbi:glyoxylase I 4 [Oryza sativa Japonica Group]|uniref:Os05g0171900 protein n=6 Tax=Oryza TaxID=4527 RepID=B9FHZ2_ORYSJ|nr:uncharacterized protein LOC4337946 [Oryza sativa Japonica Group]EAY96717.1 hypothetical protein OsI_18636 [Oryza sativa Indica Group]KAB8098307.1 hypothetical protein EE612_027412 [Oryza sativa]AAU44337.1 unknown protein [Oryza sativa Japonica Group]EEE62498.1 hypothetical protein OsJ_17296 [Oryza sativa Japonica Group]KAF2929372.1 hypothetical protein DAI22_05g052800 [Oryza sativa Japonica Group]|eukprot:NP_001054776.1 Os05g0171900 [Oryza sativa Japonica Group]